MRVATFNIRHAEGIDGRVDLSRIADVISALDAEVVALQEVDRGWERSGGIDQPAELERMTGLEVHFRPTIVRADGAEYGIAIIGPGPLEPAFEILPRVRAEEPRGVISVDVRGVTVLATHLSRSREARVVQTRRLAEAARAAGTVVVMGDLNQPRRYLRPLHEAGLAEGAARVRTLPSARPTRQVDYVLAGGGARVVEAGAPRTTASDHRPLVAVVEIPGPRTST